MTDFTAYISDFLAGKKLMLNSQKSYRYDLEQFCQQISDKLDDYSLRLYQESLNSMKPSAQKRKVSSVNQFLYFLYDNGVSDRFYKLKAVDKVPVQTKPNPLLDLALIYEKNEQTTGQLIALLIVEMGLTPSELIHLKVDRIDKDFQVMTVERAGAVRVLPLSESLLPYLNWEEGQTYLFDREGQPYSRQWFFTQLSAFLAQIGLVDMTAQKLREQYILRQERAGLSMMELAKTLGLKKTATLEKYYKHGH